MHPGGSASGVSASGRGRGVCLQSRGLHPEESASSWSAYRDGVCFRGRGLARAPNNQKRGGTHPTGVFCFFVFFLDFAQVTEQIHPRKGATIAWGPGPWMLLYFKLSNMSHFSYACKTKRKNGISRLISATA